MEKLRSFFGSKFDIILVMFIAIVAFYIGYTVRGVDGGRFYEPVMGENLPALSAFSFDSVREATFEVGLTTTDLQFLSGREGAYNLDLFVGPACSYCRDYVKQLLPIAVSRDDFNVNVHLYYYSVASEGVEFASLVRCGGDGLSDESRVSMLADMFDAYPNMDNVFSVAGTYGGFEDPESLNACVESVSATVSLDIATKAGLALDVLPYTVVHGRSFGGTFPSEYFKKVLDTVH